ncbi:VWA domain-containing protein [Pseudobacteriovorax antillogorgiicola]|nr:VWA domain-containing protein [Pseudobacteriovorax antillogorgiicola]
MEFFHDVEVTQSIKDDFYEWLKEAKPPRHLTEEQKAMMEALNLKEVRDLFEQRLKEQQERHDGGNRWIGTGGASPFGHGGFNPAGIRVGGPGKHGMAMQIAARRQFKNFRKDLVLDTRQIGLALKKLRQWGREGSREELDIEATIDATGKNAGEIELIFKPERRNTVKLLLLMDVGGSMTYHSRVCELLFSAAFNSAHFKQFKHYYFHNCPYETLYSDIEMEEGSQTLDVLRELDDSWFVFVVGDAAMSPYELTEVGGAIDYYHQNTEPGILWVKRIKDHFPRSVWLNPEPRSYWQIPSNMIVRKVFPEMFPMTIEGIEEAIAELKRPR